MENTEKGDRKRQLHVKLINPYFIHNIKFVN